MSTIAGLYRCIDACNGEIRIQAVRYGRGWYCLVSVIEADDDVWEKFDDLVGGDPEYFAARDFFSAETDGNHILAIDSTPEKAMIRATTRAAELLEGYDE